MKRFKTLFLVIMLALGLSNCAKKDEKTAAVQLNFQNVSR